MINQSSAVFLDRDGTIITDKHYAFDPAGIEFIDGALDGLRRLEAAGFRLFVVTNQSGVARGYFDENDVWAMHARLDALLRQAGVTVDRFLHCPHHPDGVIKKYAFSCLCRKPKPGMIWRAASEESIDLAQSWVIGDAPSDVLAGVRAGCKTVLLDGPRSREALPVAPFYQYRARGLDDAATFIVRQVQRAPTLVTGRR